MLNLGKGACTHPTNVWAIATGPWSTLQGELYEENRPEAYRDLSIPLFTDVDDPSQIGPVRAPNGTVVSEAYTDFYFDSLAASQY